MRKFLENALHYAFAQQGEIGTISKIDFGTTLTISKICIKEEYTDQELTQLCANKKIIALQKKYSEKEFAYLLQTHAEIQKNI